jgi:hypothetical protein
MIKTNPIFEFIPREPNQSVQPYLTLYSDFLEEIVNFGSHVMTWEPIDYEKGKQGLPVTLFLRNYLSYIDACSLLVKFSSIEPCYGLLRTSFENLLYILYLLDDETGNKGMGYIIWNAFEKSKLLTKHDGNSKEYLKLVDCYKNTDLLNNILPPIVKNIDERKEKNKRHIDSSEYSEIVNEYHRTSTKFKKQFPWYSLFDGPSTIRDLSKNLHLEGLYEILYKNWSVSTHGTSVIDGIVTGDENNIAQISQIRLPFDAESVTGTGIYLSTYLLSKYIRTKVPYKEIEFKQWYKQFSIETRIIQRRSIFKSK